jgi:hypothetical protein
MVWQESVLAEAFSGRRNVSRRATSNSPSGASANKFDVLKCRWPTEHVDLEGGRSGWSEADRWSWPRFPRRWCKLSQGGPAVTMVLDDRMTA